MKRTLKVLVFMLSVNTFGHQLNNGCEDSIAEMRATQGVVTSTFSISSLGCSSDASDMQRTLSRTKGVKACKVSAKDGTAVVTYDANTISKEEITMIIEDCSLCHDKTVKPFKVTAIK